MTPYQEKARELIQIVVNMAYQCGQQDSPSFVVPYADKIFGYKELNKFIIQAYKDGLEKSIELMWQTCIVNGSKRPILIWKQFVEAAIREEMKK